MKLDVAFGPQGLVSQNLAGRSVFVIDVLRATTTICAAIHAGAKAVLPLNSIEEAIKLSHSIGSADTVLAGERNCEPIQGFHLGNSPGSMTPETVGGKLMIMTTTNGTRALTAALPGAAIFVTSLTNLSMAGEQARRILEDTGDLLILCAGRDQAFGLDDAYTAGRLASLALGGRRRRKGLNDAALVALDLFKRFGNRADRALGISAAGRQLAALGYHDDIALAAEVDRYPILPEFRDRRIINPAAASGSPGIPEEPHSSSPSTAT